MSAARPLRPLRPAAAARRSEQRRTPQTTIEAVMFTVRERGPKALHEPANIERLGRCDTAALGQIDARMAKLKRGRE
jgi:hypothetical protein